MLSVTDLLSITTKPQRKDIDLQTILLFYEEHLCNNKFIYELEDSNQSLLQLRFEPDQLCHLLGIHYILKGQKYSGKSGYDLIKDKTVTFDYLNKVNSVWFKSKRNRMLYLPFIYQLLKMPTIIQFVSGDLSTTIDVELILYSQQENTYLHLGVSKYSDSNFYYPKSFYERNNRDHIDGQKQIEIKSKIIDVK